MKTAQAYATARLAEKRIEPSFKIGEVTGKLGRQQALLGNLDTPGPGHYYQSVQTHKGGAPKFSLGRRDGISKETLLESKLNHSSEPGERTQIRRCD